MSDSTLHEVSAQLVRDLIKEKRSEKRWKNVRFFLVFALIALIVINIFSRSDRSSVSTFATGQYAALVRINGMIAPDREASAEDLVSNLKDAFSDKHAAGVVIDINSPGGTPVQAAIIHDAILAYKKQYKKKVIIVGEDLLTSGAYFVAVAGDEIYVNPSTLTGSIGVIMKGFGFVDLMKKVGIERRVYTAGNNKDRLDPFLPQNPDDLVKIQTVMSEVHQNFVNAVLTGRKGKLKADPAILFSGDFWSGEAALKLGLVDHLGNLMDAMQQSFGTTQFKEYGGGTSLLRMITGQLNSSFDSVVYSVK